MNEMTDLTFEDGANGNVLVSATAGCGRRFTNVIEIVEPLSANPGIKIITPSGIIGSNLLRRVLTEMENWQ